MSPSLLHLPHLLPSVEGSAVKVTWLPTDLLTEGRSGGGGDELAGGGWEHGWELGAEECGNTEWGGAEDCGGTRGQGTRGGKGVDIAKT